MIKITSFYISESSRQAKTLPRPVQLIGCFIGLQISYLTWGLLQEKILTQKYIDSIGNIGQFSDSQFLVFVNRSLAFAVALLCITFFKQPTHKAPLYKYSYCAFSNIMSSWCQYEALKFISFPTQVLAKASKIIPVMIMGWIISRKKYKKYEYVVAITISIGMGLFLSGSSVDSAAADSGMSTTFSGFILLLTCVICSSFTSTWQKELFVQYKMSTSQAMCGANLFGCLFTTVSLMQHGTFLDALVFMSQFPYFTLDCVLLSLCSAIGQFFINYTIKVFGKGQRNVFYHHCQYCCVFCLYFRSCYFYYYYDCQTLYCYLTVLSHLWSLNYSSWCCWCCDCVLGNIYQQLL
jgi:adenosine 3'-phospho 5'-phosphosulfate transporter B2